MILYASTVSFIWTGNIEQVGKYKSSTLAAADHRIIKILADCAYSF